jgi:hypothetical protein
MSNYKKTFEVVHKIEDDDGKKRTLVQKFCCEMFYRFFESEKIKFDKEDRHGNEYPYVELLTIQDDASIPDDWPPREERRSAQLCYITHCFFCGYKFHSETGEQKLWHHNQYFCR